MNCSVTRCSQGGYQVCVPRSSTFYFATLWEAMDAAYTLVKNGQAVDVGVPATGGALSDDC